MILRGLKSHPDQIDVALRGSDASSRLFLKAVQNINGTTEANGISGAVGIRIEILNQLKDSGTSKALEGFGVGMFLTALRQIESVPKNILYICGKLLEVFLLLPTHRSGFLVLMRKYTYLGIIVNRCL